MPPDDGRSPGRVASAGRTTPVDGFLALAILVGIGLVGGPGFVHGADAPAAMVLASLAVALFASWGALALAARRAGGEHGAGDQGRFAVVDRLALSAACAVAVVIGFYALQYTDIGWLDATHFLLIGCALVTGFLVTRYLSAGPSAGAHARGGWWGGAPAERRARG